mgnify:CR=1 FL=1
MNQKRTWYQRKLRIRKQSISPVKPIILLADENEDENIVINSNDIINQNENESQPETQTENADESENEDENIITNQNEDHEEVDLADMVDVEVQTDNDDNTQTQMDNRYGRRSSSIHSAGSKTSRLWASTLHSRKHCHDSAQH